MAGGIRLDLDGRPVAPLKICMIGAGGFIGSHLCEALMWETHHTVIAIDVSGDKIEHLLKEGSPWSDRISFHAFNIRHDSRLETFIRVADLTINLAAICTPADYNTRPLDTIHSNFVDALPVVRMCADYNKRLIHFSTCEVYGKTLANFLPRDSLARQDPRYFVLKEDQTPYIYGPVELQRWSYACAKQLIERVIYGESMENGLQFTIVRPFNWIGPRMDFIPGIDGPSDGVPRVLACFSTNLLRGEPLKLVDGGRSQRTFVYIKDAIKAVMLMIENPERANGHIFNVGNPKNEATIRELAEMMVDVYSRVSGEPIPETPMLDISSQAFYGEGYDDSDRRIPDMVIIQRQLGWEPQTPLPDLLEITLKHQYLTYAAAVKASMAAERADPVTQVAQMHSGLVTKTAVSVPVKAVAMEF
uniref:UDP-apiose/UDP-xylose synthase n=1 Tax=Netrium digitus TaxID=43946 RepID=A0A1B3TP33_9VIRI|nr:UDP-apiose/UDP-xylose synthase [Netrium digitus]